MFSVQISCVHMMKCDSANNQYEIKKLEKILTDWNGDRMFDKIVDKYLLNNTKKKILYDIVFTVNRDGCEYRCDALLPRLLGKLGNKMNLLQTVILEALYDNNNKNYNT